MCTEEEYKKRFMKMESRINTLWDAKEAVHPIDLRFSMQQKSLKELSASQEKLQNSFDETMQGNASIFVKMKRLVEVMDEKEKLIAQIYKEMRWYFFGTLVMFGTSFAFFIAQGWK